MPHNSTPLPSSAIRPPADPRVALCTFGDIHFRLTDPEHFLKAPKYSLAPKYTNFEGVASGQKTIFSIKLLVAQKILSKIESLQSFGRAQKINLVDVKQKGRHIFPNFFLETRPLSIKS